MAKAPKNDTTTDPQVDAPVQDAATDVATDAPDLSGPAPTPDAAGADNPGPTPEELQAKADAEAAEAAEAQAKADAEAAEAAEAQAKADAAAAELAAQAGVAPPPLDVERLQLLIGQIERLNHTGHRLGLVDELRDLYGMDVAQADDDTGRVIIDMAGITIDLAPDMETALNNWANAARRAVAQAAG